MQSATFFEALAHILPADCLKTAAEDMRPYECDGLSMYRALPKCVALPENEAQLAAVMKLCHAHRVPVVARGAGRSSAPVKTFLKGTMPAFTNMSVGSLCGTSGALGTFSCPVPPK